MTSNKPRPYGFWQGMKDGFWLCAAIGGIWFSCWIATIILQ